MLRYQAGDMRGIEDSINPRAKPWVRVFYEDNQVVGVIYRQPGLSNERKNQLGFVNRICNKYGSNVFATMLDTKSIQQLERDESNRGLVYAFIQSTVAFNSRLYEKIFSSSPNSW